MILTKHDDIKAWLKDVGASKTTIDDNGIVFSPDIIDLSNKNLTEISVQFGKVGFFDCSGNKLTSLLGAPQCVEESFLCQNNRLINLVGGPQIVGKSYFCYANSLISLMGAPRVVPNTFQCHSNLLKTLEFCPEDVASFIARDNPLETLRYYPKKIKDYVSLGHESIKIKEGLEYQEKSFFKLTLSEIEKILLFYELKQKQPLHPDKGSIKKI